MDEIKSWIEREVKFLIGQLGNKIFGSTGAEEVTFVVNAVLHRSGECAMEVRVEGTSSHSSSAPKPSCKDKPCDKHEDKPCKYSTKPAKDAAPKKSSSLNDALNKLAAEVDEKNKPKE
jgi:hypothetical protein